MKALKPDSCNPLQNITEFKRVWEQTPSIPKGANTNTVKTVQHIHNMYFAEFFFLIQVFAFFATLTVRTLLQLNVAVLYFHSEKEFEMYIAKGCCCSVYQMYVVTGNACREHQRSFLAS